MKALTKVERRVLQGMHPNAGFVVFRRDYELAAMERLRRWGLIFSKRVKGRDGSTFYYYATKAGMALLKSLKGGK